MIDVSVPLPAPEQPLFPSGGVVPAFANVANARADREPSADRVRLTTNARDGRKLGGRRALLACAASALVHAAFVAALGLWTLASRASDDGPLVAETSGQPFASPMLEVSTSANTPAVVDASDGATSDSTVAILGPAAINLAAMTPRIEPANFATNDFRAMQPAENDRELATSTVRRVRPRTRAFSRASRAAAPQPPDDDRLVIELSPDLKPMGGMFMGRQPRLKTWLLRKLGGSDETEAAIRLGLDWLKRHQQPDGRWCLHSFSAVTECHGQCSHAGLLSDSAGTALGVLPFLGAGNTHLEGEFAPLVERGLVWLINNQKNDGGWSDGGIVKMYAHGLATIALAEAYAMTGDQRLRKPLEKAVGHIIEHQDGISGGWRYHTEQPGDTSVTGWQLMALRSAQAGGVAVPKEVYEQAMNFLSTSQPDKNRGLFNYGQNLPVTDTMTAAGLLSREYGGWTYDNPALKAGVNALVTTYLPKREKPNIYYWYYATQVLHHVGGKPWQTWNAIMPKLLIELQIKAGHMTGSWTPKDRFDMAGGRLYMTSLAVLTLEAYYRHMPIYARYSVAQEKNPANKRPAAK